MNRLLLERILCRIPSVYRILLNFRKPFNCEKSTYLKLVRRGDAVIEVGANLGYFTGLFGNIVGSKGVVLAFEPIPHTREQLLLNTEKLKQVSILPYAISDQQGDFEMFIPGCIHGQASLRQHSSSGWKTVDKVTSVTVKCKALSEITQVRSLSRIDFMKVDVEGAELLVLKGARDILMRDHPILHLEIEDRWMNAFGYGASEIESFLRSIGYTYFATYDRDWIVLDSIGGLDGVNVVCARKPLVFS